MESRKKKCVAFGCVSDTYQNKTWCRHHIKEGVECYLKYKSAEKRLVTYGGLSFVHHTHLSRITTRELYNWSISKLGRAYNDLLEVIASRSKCFTFFYAELDKSQQRLKYTHERAIHGCTATAELIKTTLQHHVALHKPNAVILYNEGKTPRRRCLLETKRPRRTITCSSSSSSSCVSANEKQEAEEVQVEEEEDEKEEEEEKQEAEEQEEKKVDSDEDIDRFLREITKMNASEEQSEAFFVHDLVDCQDVRNQCWKTRLPTDEQWFRLIQRVNPATMYQMEKEKTPNNCNAVTIKVSMFPFHVFGSTIVYYMGKEGAKGTKRKEQPFSVFWPNCIRAALCQMAAVVTLSNKIFGEDDDDDDGYESEEDYDDDEEEEEDDDEDDEDEPPEYIKARVVELAGEMYEAWVSPEDDIYGLPGEWYQTLFCTIEPFLKRCTDSFLREAITQYGTAAAVSDIRPLIHLLLMRVFFYRCSILVFHKPKHREKTSSSSSPTEKEDDYVNTYHGRCKCCDTLLYT